MLDHVITKPGTVAPYQAHQMVEGLTKGSAALFADVGEALLIRSSEPITEQGKAIRECKAGEVVGFELRACVSKKRKERCYGKQDQATNNKIDNISVTTRHNTCWCYSNINTFWEFNVLSVFQSVV